MQEEEITFEQTEFKPKEASERDWKLLHEYRRREQAEKRPDDPIIPDPVVEAQLKKEDPFRQPRYFGIELDEQLVSALGVHYVKPASPDYESKKHLLLSEGYVLPEWRRKGLGKSWLPLCLKLMEDTGTTTITFDAELPDGHAFLQWLGAEEKFTGAENRLDFTQVDWDMVDRWVEEGRRRSAEAKLEFYKDRVPEHMWEEVAPVYTEIVNDMPLDELDMGKWQITPERIRDDYERMTVRNAVMHTYLTREPDGAISSYTEIIYSPNRPGMIDQRSTGVLNKYRGRGLGKWIKAAMLQYIKETYPDTKWVVTGNANSNAPMLAINKALGFREYKSGKAYQMSKDKLAEFVRSL